ncbi:hypothetical protein QBC46DRAFT_267589 [Diplogelasinospora grovesii]|uniref:C2H2-type domain-containing protein n=1 Tax=Diplogelasinospora grovesii TaxID=303347 RepID=A0AAN6S1U4_9PEZI|nr:hypothetical protein QBC46DRAFT_267589 [Diplogelasinospora grovesii]
MDYSYPTSADMMRSESSTTQFTNDSVFSETSTSSGQYSVDGYTTLNCTSNEEAPAYEYTTAPFPPSYQDSQWSSASVIASAGSQYGSQNVPRPFLLTTSLDILNSAVGNIEGATTLAMQWASSQLTNSVAVEPSLITSSAVNEALRQLQGRESDSPEREAVQSVLYSQLDLYCKGIDQFEAQTRIVQALQESAYQLQCLIEGPHAWDICFYAIADILARLQSDLECGLKDDPPAKEPAKAHGHSKSQSSSSGEKEKYRCLFSGCKQKAFGRSADLDRHYKMVHLEDEKKIKYLCDYKKCPRNEQPFFRPDHFRDHLRDYHKEDLTRRGVLPDPSWWGSRSNHAMFDGWWRCNRCLTRRVSYDKYGFVCPKCQAHCEPERQRQRRHMAEANYAASRK